MTGPLRTKPVPITSPPPRNVPINPPLATPRQSQDYNFAGPASRMAVCYTYPPHAPALILPPGVLALSHHNYGEGFLPVETPSVSAQAWNAESNVDGAVVNYEPVMRRRGDSVEVLKRWASLFRRTWPSGLCVAYGADTGINNPDWNTTPHAIAMALRKPKAKDEQGPTRFASLGLDGYKRRGDTDLAAFAERLAWKAERLERFYELTKTPGTWFIDVQDQFTYPGKSYSVPVIHRKEWVLAQIDACPKKANLCIFAGASNADAREIVDQAVLNALGWAKERRDEWKGTGSSKPETLPTSEDSAG
jgi:hypothetical protein